MTLFQKNVEFKISQSFKEIFPPRLLFLVFTPFLLGLFIDHELIEWRDVAINLVWISFFTIPLVLFKRRWIWTLAITLFFFFGLIEIAHWIILKGPITLTSLLVISNTNIQESIEFLSVKASVGLLVLLPYILLYIYSLRHVSSNVQSKVNGYLIGFIFLISTGFIVESTMNHRFIRKATPPFVRVTLSLITQKKLYTEAMQELSPRNIDVQLLNNNKQQTFVLILGESCNRKHMSLYGASRKTNPKLEARKDLIVYDNVVSPYSNTIQSVLSLLSNSNLEHPLNFDQSIDLIDVFHSAGFKTYWISNQSPIGIWDNMVTVLAKKSDEFRFVNTSGNSSFEATQTISYDEKLFDPFASVLKDTISKKFIVLHLMGSHTAYDKRYPSSFNIFRGNNHRERVIARYDNSVLYNDFVVDSLIDMIRVQYSSSTQGIASVIYLSDHGENVYDEFDRVGHDYSNQLPKANVEIPFLVWLSPAYILHDSLKVATMISSKNQPFVTDDLFHAIIDLNAIQCAVFDSTRSLFNHQFNALRPRILEDGKDYDQQ